MYPAKDADLGFLKNKTLAVLFRAKVVDVAHDSLLIEFTGNVTKISAFLDLIEPFGIIETARTGAVALTRGLKKASK